MSSCNHSHYNNCSDGDLIGGLCIFHSPDKRKDAASFETQLKKKTEGDFSGFVFPVNLTPSILSTEVIDEVGNRIKNEIIFREATFSEGISLQDMKFDARVVISRCTFSGACDFSRAAFTSEFILEACSISDNGCLLLHDLKFLTPDKVCFSDLDLSFEISLLKTDVGKILLRGCTSSSKTPSFWRPKSEVILYDELSQGWCYAPVLYRLLRKRGSNNNFEQVLELYRGFRSNYERRLKYPEAGEFHIGEMETRRLALLNSKQRGILSWIAKCVEYFLLWIYKVTSVYGERYTRAIGSLLLMITVFALLYMYSGLRVEKDVTEFHPIKYIFSFSLLRPDKTTLEDFMNALIYSFSVATFFLKEKIYRFENTMGLIFYIFESIMGATILSFLIISIRRKLRRSKGEVY